MGTGLMNDIIFVGLDVHKATVAVALAEGGRGGEVRRLGVFENRPAVLAKLADRLARDGRLLSFCYEAGPCGYGLHRLLSERGHDCMVVAPSLIPVRAGDRVKTDRRDAVMLAKLHRAGELTPVWVPDAAHEAMRDLVRARATASRMLTKSRQHLQAFLLRHGRIYTGKSTRTRAYRRWLTTIRFDYPAQQIVLQDYIHAIEDAEERAVRLTRQIEELAPDWSLAPVVRAFQAMRGVAFIVAVTIVAEVGDFTRFAHPRQLMAYLGLVPSEHSSGGSVRRGGITKAGNTLARRALIEAAWTYRMPARVSRTLHDRLEAQPKAVRDVAWRAQVRLCGRYRRPLAAGKAKVVAIAAIAREMVGFLWAIAPAGAARPGALTCRHRHHGAHTRGRGTLRGSPRASLEPTSVDAR